MHVCWSKICYGAKLFLFQNGLAEMLWQKATNVNNQAMYERKVTAMYTIKNTYFRKVRGALYPARFIINLKLSPRVIWFLTADVNLTMVERYFADFTQFRHPPKGCQNLLAESFKFLSLAKVLSLVCQFSRTYRNQILTDTFAKHNFAACTTYTQMDKENKAN